MFESLTQRLNASFARLRKKGQLSEADVVEALREVRVALLEADVNLRVVQGLVARIREEATGQAVLQSLSPTQSVIRIVHEALKETLGGVSTRPALSGNDLTVWMLMGLQGAGKTTAAAKLGLLLTREGRRVLLVAADRQRPAAIDQLELLGQRVGVPVFTGKAGDDALTVARGVGGEARRLGRDVAIVDTAGRLSIDAALMSELGALKQVLAPRAMILVVDAMTGQTAVEVAQRFRDEVGLDGIVLSKLDGDARAGAALSMRSAVGCPIYWASTGEKPEALEAFHPDRMASRILGMGDVLTLIERAQATVDPKEVRRVQERLRQGSITMEDFLDQLRQVRRMGPIGDLLKMIPGVSRLMPKGASVDEHALVEVEAIIQSMTVHERQHPEVIDASRRRRIARGSGTSVQAVNRLLKQFEDLRRLMRSQKGSHRPGLGPAGPFGPRFP